MEWLANRARTYFFSTAAPAAVAAAGIAALRLAAQTAPQRQALLNRANQLREALSERGWSVGPSASQIIPLQLGDAHRTMELAQRLLEAGVYAPGIRPPTVPAGESMLRISLCSPHSEQNIGQLLDGLGPAPSQ